MRTFKYPIIIDGQGYYVDKTHSGSPAIYKGIQFTHKGHIDEPDLAKHNTFICDPDEIIIIARKTNDDKKTMEGI